MKKISKSKKIKLGSNRTKFISLAVFVFAFAGIGGLIVLRSRAASGVCSVTSPVPVGTATYSVSAPETAQYRLWVRMQVPNTTNAGNTNGVKVELDGTGTSSDQCFTVTTTSSAATTSWQWINSDASVSGTPAHVTASLAAGNYTAKILGLKAGVKVDKVLLLRSDNNCTPDNVISGSGATQRWPGDNCTTPVPTVTITANPTSVISGGTTTLTWSSTNATSCTGSGAWGNSARPTSNTTGLTSDPLTTAGTSTFTITCSGAGGTSAPASAPVTVTAPQPPVVTLTASPTQVQPGGSSAISWSVTNNPTSCTASGDWSGSKTPAASGTQTITNITANRTYTLTCTGPGGTSSPASVTVTVATGGGDTQKPVVTMVITGLTISPTDTSLAVRNLKSIVWRPTATDNVGVTSVVYRVNNAQVSLTGGAYTFGNTPGSNGDYDLQVVASDAAGNSETKNLQIRLRHPDIDRGGTVDLTDLSYLLGRYGQTNNRVADFDLNGTIDITDLSYLLGRWGSTQ